MSKLHKVLLARDTYLGSGLCNRLSRGLRDGLSSRLSRGLSSSLLLEKLQGTRWA